MSTYPVFYFFHKLCFIIIYNFSQVYFIYYYAAAASATATSSAETRPVAKLYGVGTTPPQLVQFPAVPHAVLVVPVHKQVFAAEALGANTKNIATIKNGNANVIPDLIGDPGFLALDSRLRGNDKERHGNDKKEESGVRIFAAPKAKPLVCQRIILRHFKIVGLRNFISF